ncbi:MAG: DegT/DnrJ/EryC1/StrS aminotransferase family protein [Candidatus Baltobacteraceae bacterium]
MSRRSAFLPYCKPAVGEAEANAVTAALLRGWLTTGPQTAAFEEAFARESGVSHAVALNSCTAGLHLAMVALGVGPGDEVVMPSLTFVAGAQCAIELGARPVLCDVDPETFGATLATIAPAVTPRTKAIVTMPYAGRPVGIAEICAFARQRGIAVIEDAAHGAGTLDRGRWPGTHSDAAVFSFYATKNLTTGEGGMLLANDGTLAERVRRLSLHGMSRDAWQRYGGRGTWRYDVLEPGYKYNMPDLAASIGIVQLQRLPALQRRRDQIAARYVAGLAGLPGIACQRRPDHPDDRHSWCMFALLVDEPAAGISRDAFVEELRRRNVGTSVHYIPTHAFSAYGGLAVKPLPATDAIARCILSLPLYPQMTDVDVEDVLDAVDAVLARGDAATVA